MFETLFSRPPAIQRQRTGPLAVERVTYIKDLADQGTPHAPRCANGRTTAYALPVNLKTGRGIIDSVHPNSTPWLLHGRSERD
jgi:hypothetical protein